MPDDIEMTTFKSTDVTRLPNGDLDGTVTLKAGSYIEFKFDSATGIFEVKTILSEAPGDGGKLMSEAYTFATHAGATSMSTATSRPGFFRKYGFVYSPQQEAINARKYTPEELSAQEANRGDAGGGFDMVKTPPFA